MFFLFFEISYALILADEIDNVIYLHFVVVNDNTLKDSEIRVVANIIKAIVHNIFSFFLFICVLLYLSGLSARLAGHSIGFVNPWATFSILGWGVISPIEIIFFNGHYSESSLSLAEKVSCLDGPPKDEPKMLKSA